MGCFRSRGVGETEQRVTVEQLRGSLCSSGETVGGSDAAGATQIEVVRCPQRTREVDFTANIVDVPQLSAISPRFFSRVRFYCVNAWHLLIVLRKARGVRRALSQAVRGRARQTRVGQGTRGGKAAVIASRGGEIAVRTHRTPRPLPADGKQPTTAAGGAHAVAHLTPTPRAGKPPLRSLHPAPHGGDEHRDQHAERKREQRRECRPAPRARLLIYRVERRGTRVV